MSDPHVEQKWLVTVVSLPGDLGCVYVFRTACPRKCFRWVSWTMKPVECIEAVILWQSVQLQINETTNPGPWVGYSLNRLFSSFSSGNIVGIEAYKRQLHGAAEAGCGCFVRGGPPITSDNWEVRFGFASS